MDFLYTLVYLKVLSLWTFPSEVEVNLSSEP